MRKLIITIIAMLIPFGLWTAGCRQNKRVAAFPTTPEMRNIARAPEQDYATRAPVIPAAIDREILNTPDQPTFARIRAVMDRSEILTNRPSDPGLFVLPQQDEPALAYGQQSGSPVQFAPQAPVYVTSQPEPQFASAPVPSAPTAAEFWSRPSGAPTPAAQYVPADVSAMMPASPSVPTESFIAPVPSPVFEPASTPEPVGFPEDIPGVFMGSDGSGLIGQRSEAADPSLPLLSSAAFESVSVDDINAHMRQERPRTASPEAGQPLQAWRPNADGPDLDLVALLNPVAAPPPPEARVEPNPQLSEKLEALLNSNDIRQALAPLPDISAMAPASAVSGAAAPAAAVSLPTTHADVIPAPPVPTETPALVAVDLPAAAPVRAPEPLIAENPVVEKPAETASVLLPLPELPEPVAAPTPMAPPTVEPALPAELSLDPAEADALLREIIESTRETAAPQKVSMTPREPRTGTAPAGFKTIDADTAVPPLRF